MVGGFTPVPLSGCRCFPSPCAVAGRARGRAHGLAPTRALPGLAPLFASRDLLAVPLRARSGNSNTLESTPANQLPPRDIPPCPGRCLSELGRLGDQMTCPCVPGRPGGARACLDRTRSPRVFFQVICFTPLPAGRTRKPLPTFARPSSVFTWSALSKAPLSFSR